VVSVFAELRRLDWVFQGKRGVDWLFQVRAVHHLPQTDWHQVFVVCVRSQHMRR
jgi:hypothetical protein|tara:strand:+ start:1107 stop:1268 length:162 start_codon:yes stop_codon:yes gene_type:complete